jgi:hypothetical protein
LFGNSEPALIQGITDEILKYPASIGWYTTGIAKGRVITKEREMFLLRNSYLIKEKEVHREGLPACK